ncbi:unnamed protein product [Prorocentrum cordatum]|uniref:Uncharacterized protein n=1 Tax=Prorocentrum cordatum TaxID=2364126 RepID=A0ABN9QIH2_9DINO|nr:unnamed protein product [Polarella glacialis]
MMFFGLYLVPSFFLWRFANAYMDGRRKLREQLATFCVERSKCFLEAHRQALLADIADRFGSVQEFERFIRTELPPVISVLRQAPVPLMTAIVGAISHFFFFTAIIASAIQQGKADVAARGAITLPIVWLCTDSLALNLVLVLAGRVLASERPPPPTTDRSYSGRRHASWRHALPHYPGRLGRVLRSRIVRSLLGPLTSATVFAGLCAIGISVFFPVLGVLRRGLAEGRRRTPAVLRRAAGGGWRRICWRRRGSWFSSPCVADGVWRRRESWSSSACVAGGVASRVEHLGRFGQGISSPAASDSAWPAWCAARPRPWLHSRCPGLVRGAATRWSGSTPPSLEGSGRLGTGSASSCVVVSSGLPR